METVLFSKENLREILSESVIEITFEKVDGTLREMAATLNSEIIPAKEEVEEGVEVKAKAKSDTSLAVWDTEKNAWRSFKWENLKTVNGMPVKIEA